MPGVGVTTISGPGPGPVRLGALEIASSKIGERETGRNAGPIVDWSLEGLTSHPAAGDDKRRPGWAQWCAFFVSQCVRRELDRRGDDALLREWVRELASGSCDSLWRHLEARGWVWLRGAPLPQALSPQGVDAPGLPGAGDFVFFGVPGDLAHVGYVERLDGAAGRLHTVEGNAGDRVAALDHPADHPRIVGYARVPW